MKTAVLVGNALHFDNLDFSWAIRKVILCHNVVSEPSVDQSDKKMLNTSQYFKPFLKIISFCIYTSLPQ